MIPPGAVDVQVPAAQALLTEAKFLNYPAAGLVLRPDAGLDAVQADHEETVVDRDGHRGRSQVPARIRLIDPVADLRRTSRAPDDAAHGQLAGEPPAVSDHPWQRQALPGLTPHGARHGHVRADVGPVERCLRVGRLPAP